MERISVVSFKKAACRMVLSALAAGCIAVAMLGLVAGSVLEAEAAGGATVSVVGASTGTNIAIVRTTPGTYFGIKIASATVGDIFKVFNSSNGVGLTLSAESGLLDVVQISSDNASGQPQVQYPHRGPMDGQARHATIGISVMKSNAGGVGLVNHAQ